MKLMVIAFIVSFLWKLFEDFLLHLGNLGSIDVEFLAANFYPMLKPALKLHLVIIWRQEVQLPGFVRITFRNFDPD